MILNPVPFDGKVVDLFEDYKTKMFDPYHGFAANPQLIPTEADLGLDDLFILKRQFKDARRLIGKVHPYYLIAASRVAMLAPYEVSFNTGESHLGPYLSVEGEEQDEIVRITTHFEPVRYETSILGVWFPSKPVRGFDDWSGVTHLMGWTRRWMDSFAAEIVGFFYAMALHGDPSEYSHVGTWVTSSLKGSSRVTAVFNFRGHHVSITARESNFLEPKADDVLLSTVYQTVQRAGYNDVPTIVSIEEHARQFSVYDLTETCAINDGPNQVPVLLLQYGTKRYDRWQITNRGDGDFVKLLNSAPGVIQAVAMTAGEHINKDRADWIVASAREPYEAGVGYGEMAGEFSLYHIPSNMYYRFTVRQKK